MSDIQTGLDAHRRAVDAFLATARSVPAARWGEPRAPGRWSPGQIADHLVLAHEVSRGVLHGTTPGAAPPRFVRALIRTFMLKPVLRRGAFIPGSKSPKVMRPGESPAAPAVLLGRLQAAAAGFDADVAAAAARAATIEHPFFGQLSLIDFVRLQEIHTQHHHRQLALSAA